MPLRVAAALSLCFALAPSFAMGAEVDFSRDVLPILADKCFHCHGPDAATREADLRLDEEASAKAVRDGVVAVKPGDVAGSELIARVLSEDETLQMPPPESGRSLTQAQKDTLKAWIASGAEWGKHWAFEPPKTVEPPTSVEDRWSRNPIDRFILARLRDRAWKPSPSAEKSELIRRATFDLTGLPPTIEEVRAFIADDSPDAYDRLIDRLLASPRYGEHMSRLWLDAARYADTDGYQNDGPRDMWRWRDWVIDAYNRHQTFDQFTIDQLAGDLLEKPTFAQRLATGFNRNHRYNSEAGLVLEEFLLENAVDRVDTTATVWMGLTMGCARCHDHKYDPFSQREYYQLIAFFDNVAESGRAVKFGNSEPWMLAPTRAQRQMLVQHDRNVAEANSELQAAAAEVDQEIESWIDSGAETSEPIAPLSATGLTTRRSFDNIEGKLSPDVQTEGVVGGGARAKGETAVAIDNPVAMNCQSRFSLSFWLKIDQIRDGVILSQQSRNTRRPGLAVELRDGRLQFYIITRWVAGVGAVETTASLPANQWMHVALTNDGSQSATGMRIAINGQTAATRILFNTNSNTGGAAKNAKLIFGRGVHGDGFNGCLDELRVYNRTLFDDEIERLATAKSIPELAAAWPELSATERETLRHWFLEHQSSRSLRQLWTNRHKLRTARIKYIDSLPTSMVMSELDPPRQTFVRERGEYHRHGDVVPPTTPEVLGQLKINEANNRYDLARWLVNGQHPLTARVAVNRHWQQFFGRGLVHTAEDFGVQGEPPSHPKLLDWLALRYVESGWDTAALQRLILSSAAYRQSSRSTAESRSRDPHNVWLSRGPRLRLSAHELRDQALFVSGLLIERTGGPSVSPYQPANLWRELSNMVYRRSKGADLYRRSLYTTWKRTIAPPTMSVLDAADRETCAVRPKRTNTSIQALTLLNETAFVEAARGLAQRMMIEGKDDPIAFGFQVLTARLPNAKERTILEAALLESQKAFQAEPKSAKQFISIGESKPDPSLDPVELAAYTSLANLLLNLDEALTKQ